MSIQYTKLAVAGLTLLSTPSDVRSLVYTGASKVFDGQFVAMVAHAECGDVSANFAYPVGVVQHQHTGKSGRSTDGDNAVDVYINNDCLPVKVQGRIWVKPVGAVISTGKNTDVYVYTTTANKGQVTATDDGANTMLIDGAWWETETTPDGFAILMLDNPVNEASDALPPLN